MVLRLTATRKAQRWARKQFALQCGTITTLNELRVYRGSLFLAPSHEAHRTQAAREHWECVGDWDRNSSEWPR